MSGAGHDRDGAAGGNGRGAHRAAASAPPKVATYRDLGSFQLRSRSRRPRRCGCTATPCSGRWRTATALYGGELVRSLEAFIECNGQWEAAARRLYCHRHTLRYRIRSIEELTGRDLGSARDRIEFWLALRGRELAGKPPNQRSASRREIKTDEYRVALTPSGVRELTDHGHGCWCRRGRGGLGDLATRAMWSRVRGSCRTPRLCSPGAS